MAVVNEFNGKLYIEPTVEVAIKNGIPNVAQSVYGRILAVDTGLGAGYLSGKSSIPVLKTPALIVGIVNLSTGNNWSTTSATFGINPNSTGVVTVTLNANCTTLYQVIAHVNTRLKAAGVLDVYAYDAGTNFIGFKSKVGGTTQNFILSAGSPDALVQLGLAAATYTGTTTTGTGRMLQDMIYEFNTLNSLRLFCTGGILWDLAWHLYNPIDGAPGANNVSILKASEACQSSLTMTFASGKRLTEKTFDEGTCANGDITTVASQLSTGYAKKLIAGTVDTTKFKFQYFKGKYKGVDGNGYLYENKTLSAAAAAPTLLFETTEFTDLSEFITFTKTSTVYKTYFEIDTTNSDTSGVLSAGDVTFNAGFNVFAGGSETYSSDALSNVLSELKEYKYSFHLSLDSGDNAWANNNIAILSFLTNNKKGGKPTLHIGGQDIKEKRGNYLSIDSTTSAGAAVQLNSAYATIYHGGDYMPDSQIPANLKPISAIYTAAKCVGRRAGMEPMDSMTYKAIRSYKPQDIINDEKADEFGNIGREDLIQLGVLHVKKDPDVGVVINLDINTLQKDANLNYQTEDEGGNAISYENNSMQIKQELINLTIAEFKPRVIGKRSNEITVPVLLTQFGTFMNLRKQSGLITDYRNLSIQQKGTAYFFYGEYVEPTTIEQIFVQFSASI